MLFAFCQAAARRLRGRVLLLLLRRCARGFLFSGGEVAGRLAVIYRRVYACGALRGCMSIQEGVALWFFKISVDKSMLRFEARWGFLPQAMLLSGDHAPEIPCGLSDSMEVRSDDVGIVLESVPYKHPGTRGNHFFMMILPYRRYSVQSRQQRLHRANPRRLCQTLCLCPENLHLGVPQMG